MKLKVDASNKDTYTVCHICKQKFVRITPTHLRHKHQITLSQYIEKYGIESISSKILKESASVTEKSLCAKYGKDQGIQKWNEYRNKQSLTNTFEYKKEKYGWTREQFDEYNKARACTLENLIARHGKESGTKKWLDYKTKQKDAGCSLDYFIKKFKCVDRGTEEYHRVNKLKKLTLDNFIKKYGHFDGTEKYHAYLQHISSNAYYSAVSQHLFRQISSNKDTEYFAESKNKEFYVYDKITKRPYFYDYIDTHRKKCIEFNGDLFHANPEYYTAEDTPLFYDKGKTAADIWKFDEYKLNLIKEQGYDVLVVWENEYKNAPDLIINKCKIFLEYDEQL